MFRENALRVADKCIPPPVASLSITSAVSESDLVEAIKVNDGSFKRQSAAALR